MEPLLYLPPKSHPHLFVVYFVPTDEAVTT